MRNVRSVLRNCMVFVVVCIVVVGSSVVWAYDNVFPSTAPLAGGAYIEVQTAEVGRALIYVPIASKDYCFSVRSGTNALVNITSSTITGEMYSGSNFATHTQVRWTRFNTAEYQYTVGASTYWGVLNISTILNTNMLIANQQTEPVQLRETSQVYLLIIIAILGVVCLCLLLKRSRI